MRASLVKRHFVIASRKVVTQTSPLTCFIIGSDPIRPLRVVDMSCIVASLSVLAGIGRMHPGKPHMPHHFKRHSSPCG